MLDKLIKFSMNNRYLVVIFAFLILGVALHLVQRIPVDALPDLTGNAD